LRTSFHGNFRFFIRFSASFSISIFLGSKVFVEETQSLAIVFASVKVHLRLYLENEVPLISAKEFRSEIVLLSI
jgi:hypothetical protein